MEKSEEREERITGRGSVLQLYASSREKERRREQERSTEVWDTETEQ